MGCAASSPKDASKPSKQESLKAQYDEMIQNCLKEALKEPAPSQEKPEQEAPMPATPPRIPATDLRDPGKTQACWQCQKKTCDNGITAPALGWNSWNQFKLEVTEAKVLAVAESMKSNGLLGAGFEYIIIDDGWALPDRDADKRMQADPAKFPQGMKWLGDQLHDMGFKFGIYTTVGRVTCGFGQPGIFEHQKIDAETFASWGVDYVKVDRCGWPGELSFAPGLDVEDIPQLTRVFAGLDYPISGKFPDSFYRTTGRVQGYQDFGAVLKATGRQIYYEICDWGQDDTLNFAPGLANSFRVAWDNFPQWHRFAQIYEYFAQVKEITASVAPGTYATILMEVGVDGNLNNRDIFPASSLTQRESATEQALWCMWSCPLILGYDVANPEKSWAGDLLKNPALLKIDQDPLAIAARLAVRKREWGLSKVFTDVWVKPLAEGVVAVALVNMADTITQYSPFYKAETITVTWETLGLDPNTSVAVYSASKQKDLGQMTGSVSLEVEPHGAEVLTLTLPK